MRWIQCQRSCMTLVICGLIWQMWVTGRAWGQVNCPHSLLPDIPGLYSGLFLLPLHPNVFLPTAAGLPRYACMGLMLIIKLEELNVTTCNCCQHIPESSPVEMIGLVSDLDPPQAQQWPGQFTRWCVSLLELNQGTSDTSFMAWHKCKMSILTTTH